MDRSLSKRRSTVDDSGTDAVVSINISSPDSIKEQQLVTSSNPIKDYFSCVAKKNCDRITDFLPLTQIWGSIKAFAARERKRCQLPEKSSEILFVISCITMSLDLFFFYVPTIDENHKCLDKDYKLMIVVFMLRSLSDLAFICCRIASPIPHNHHHKSEDSDREKRKLMYERVLDLLLILPVHQVTIVMAFFRLGSYGYSYKKAAVNICLVLQLILRAYRIYNFCKKSKFGWRKACALNFFLYILAAHVLGAFWYLFSIQREISCWHRLCEDTAGCITTFNCHSNTSTSPSVTRLDESCPISSENTTILDDLGIYLHAFQSGTTNGTLDFPTKYMYTFWWGLRNLSNFGTNLETSSYVWENFFAVLISVIGMLLFSCLIGNVQKYMQSESEVVRQKIKIKMKENELMEGKSSATLSEDITRQIKRIIKISKVVEGNIDVEVNLEYAFSILPSNIKQSLKEHIIGTLKKVPILLENVDEDLLNRICLNLERVIHPQNHGVIKTGVELDRVIIVVEGDVTCTATQQFLKEGDLFGEERLTLAFPDIFSPPISNQDVMCQTEVEALALTVKKLESVLSYYRERLYRSDAQLEDLAPIVPLGSPSSVDPADNNVSSSSTSMEEKLDQLLQLQVSQGKRLEEMAAKLEFEFEFGATCKSCNLKASFS